MPERVDATVHAVKPTAPEPVLDRSRAEPERQQLLPRHDAVLTLGQSRERPVGFKTGKFPLYFRVYCDLAELGGPARTAGLHALQDRDGMARARKAPCFGVPE